MTKAACFAKAFLGAGIFLFADVGAAARPQAPQQEPAKPPAVQTGGKAKSSEQNESNPSRGRLSKLIGFVNDKLDIKAAEESAGKVPKPLTAKEKFMVFGKDSTHPLTIVTSGFYAGLSQAADTDHAYGQGAEGFGKRIGAAFGDQLAISFFESFFYPALLREDPRYYRLGSGGFGRRLGHAMAHTYVTRRDSGIRSFNFSEWLGAGSSAVISSQYHPGIPMQAQPILREAGYRILGDMSLDIAREFVPGLMRKLERMVSHGSQAQPAGGPKK